MHGWAGRALASQQARRPLRPQPASWPWPEVKGAAPLRCEVILSIAERGGAALLRARQGGGGK